MEVKHQKQRSQQSSAPGLLNLPSDLLQLVLELLGVAELARRLRTVCRAASVLMARCAAVALQAHRLTAPALDGLFRYLDASRLKSLRLRLDPEIDLTFGGCSFPSLEALWLSSQKLSNRGLETVLSAAPRLQSLKLTRCYGLTSWAFKSIRLARLHCLWWSGALNLNLILIDDGRFLEFGARFSVGEYEGWLLSECGTAFSNLQSLNVKTIVYATPNSHALDYVLAKTPRLVYLRLDTVVFGWVPNEQQKRDCAARVFSSCPSLERLEVRVVMTGNCSRDSTGHTWTRAELGSS